MIGGGSGAFIGAVHRRAAELDGLGSVVAGALSSTPDRSLASARAWGLAPDRSYASWSELLERESARPAHERVECVAIVTPNHTHFEIARAALEKGFHVVLDKPVTHTSEQAAELSRLVREKQRVFAVTYTFAGYPMVQHAARLVRAGALGTLRRVYVEFLQGWLANPIEQPAPGAEPQKQADWRTDPARSGPAGTLGDIGTHCEHIAALITGLGIESLAADVVTHVPHRKLDDDASVLIKFTGGARGVLSCSQVCAGEECAIRIRVYGERGGLEWDHERCNELVVMPLDGPRQIITRAGAGLGAIAPIGTRLPGGHPEGFHEAFANIYAAALREIMARRDVDASQRSTSRHAPLHTATDLSELPPDRMLYPTIDDGLRGVRFIERCLQSRDAGGAWVAF
ncbi:MAG: Gfo/Idh/MocA family oxidoreductase [Phycisphaerales bacterium]|jgi:predicted dehydrogenase|nr:Gfo/Idh/MocA family oxidoreductase [Phycisphaerales bacterium]